MVVTRRSGADAAIPGGDESDGRGRDGGKGVRGRSKRSATSILPARPTKRVKAEARAPAPKKKKAPRATAAGENSGPAGTNGRPWAKLLSQYPQTPHVLITGSEVSVGSGDNCHIYLDEQDVSRNLCLLRHLELEGPCELEVTGKSGPVVVNGAYIIRGTKVPLRGDEVILGRSGNHAYIFQHPLKDTEVAKGGLISADSSADTGPTILESCPNNLEAPLEVLTPSVEDNQRGSESALENQSGFRCPNPSSTLSLRGWQTFKDGLKQGILSPKDIDVTLDNFPYYLSENTKEALLLSGFMHMEKEYKKYFPKVPSPNQRILLSGPSGSEIYQEMLIKALAKHFDARLLILDSLMLCGTSSKFQESLKDVRSDDEPTSSSGADIVGTSKQNTFREGDRVEYIGDHSLMSTTSAYGYRGKVMLTFETNGSSKVGVRFDNPIPNGNDLGGLCEINHGFFCHAVELQPDSSSSEEVNILALGKLIEVLSEESKNSNLIVLLKDAEKPFTKCTESHAPLSKLPPGVLIIGSHTQAESRNDQVHSKKFDVAWLPNGNQALLTIIPEAIKSMAEKSITATESTMHLLFPNKILIELPQNEAQQSDLKKQLKVKANISNFRKILTSNEIECNDLEELSINDHLLTNENVDKIVRYAVSHHLRHINHAKGAKMVLPIESLKLAFSVVLSTHSENKTSKSALKDVIIENKFEEKVLSNVISPNDSGVTFVDIGALDSVKETLKELVVLPLQRPELFNEVKLRKPVKGILLFGPPGTGKTILAKAVAKEAGAKFIDMSIFITSKWFGEIEKYVEAIFSLASKLSPAVIFVDEIDRLLGNRVKPGEHEAMRRMKNEFMINWDVFRNKEQEHVIILGATNRPFDLDDDVIQRFPHRLMVSLPDASNREKILRIILFELPLGPDIDIQSVANMTKGYSVRDLNNLCFTAVHRPIREIVEKEKKEKSLAIAEGRPEPPLYGVKDVRPLGMDDLKFALGQVHASFPPDSTIMNQLVKWNDEFGDGGSRKKETLGYFM